MPLSTRAGYRSWVHYLSLSIPKASLQVRVKIAWLLLRDHIERQSNRYLELALEYFLVAFFTGLVALALMGK